MILLLELKRMFMKVHSQDVHKALETNSKCSSAKEWINKLWHIHIISTIQQITNTHNPKMNPKASFWVKEASYTCMANLCNPITVAITFCSRNFRNARCLRPDVCARGIDYKETREILSAMKGFGILTAVMAIRFCSILKPYPTEHLWQIHMPSNL